MAFRFLSAVLNIPLETSCVSWHSVAMVHTLVPIKPNVWLHGKMRPGVASLQLYHVGLPYSNHVANDDRCQGWGGYPPSCGG